MIRFVKELLVAKWVHRWYQKGVVAFDIILHLENGDEGSTNVTDIREWMVSALLLMVFEKTTINTQLSKESDQGVLSPEGMVELSLVHHDSVNMTKRGMTRRRLQISIMLEFPVGLTGNRVILVVIPMLHGQNRAKDFLALCVG